MKTKLLKNKELFYKNKKVADPILSKINQSIFDFYGTVFEVDYDNYYGRFQNALNDKFNKFTIKPTLFFFIDDITNNAFADQSNEEYNIIGINKELFHNISFIEMETLDLPDLRYLELNQSIKLENQIKGFTMWFIFYHEYAHLLQKNGINILYFENEKSTTFEQQKQIKEFDADIFASILITEHILQVFNDQVILPHTIQEQSKLINDLIALGSSSICLFISFFGDFKSEFYLKEKTHPHPIFRLFYTLAIIIDCCIFQLDNPELDITYGKILDSIFLINKTIFKSLDKNNFGTIEHREFSEIWDNFVEEGSVYSEYYKELQKFVDDDQSSAYHQIKILRENSRFE